MVVSATVEAEFKALAVTILLLSETDNPLKVVPVLLRLNAPVLTTVALPVVPNVIIGVDVLILPILPAPEVKAMDVVPVKTPVVSVIAPVPLAVRLTIVPLAPLAPMAIVPLLLVANVKPAVDVSAVLSVKLLSVVTDKPLKFAPPWERVIGPAPLLTTMAVPVVFKVRAGVVVLTLPMFPDPELRDNDTEPVNVPVVPEIAPEPLALRATAVPLMLFAPKAMALLPAVVLKFTAPAELSAPVTVKLLESETVKEANWAPPDVKVAAPVLVTVALPVVFKVKASVVVLMGPIAPEPLLKLTDEVPTTEPPPVIGPVVEALTMTFRPCAVPPLMAMPPVAVLADSVRVPPAVMLWFRVMAPAPAAVSIKLKLAPVDAKLPVMACESVKVTLPVVLALILGVVSDRGPIKPAPEVSATDVVPVMVPAPVIVPPAEVVIASTVPETAVPKEMLPAVLVTFTAPAKTKLLGEFAWVNEIPAPPVSLNV